MFTELLLVVCTDSNFHDRSCNAKLKPEKIEAYFFVLINLIFTWN